MRSSLYRVLLTVVLLSVALSSFGLAFTLLHLLNRFAKDLAEVVATWQIIHSCVVVGIVALAGWWVGRRQSWEC